MRSPAKVLSFSALFVFAVVAALMAPACSNQDEGGVCDRQAEGDCNAGLVCTPTSELNQVEVTIEADRFKGRCCPTNRAAATVTICQLPDTPHDSDAALPPETGTGTGESDGGPEAAPTEASTPDATDDGG